MLVFAGYYRRHHPNLLTSVNEVNEVNEVFEVNEVHEMCSCDAAVVIHLAACWV